MELIEGRLFDIALEKLRSNGYNLRKLVWDADSYSMNISYSHVGIAMTLEVRGLPEDIPSEIFEGFMDHFIKTEIRGMKKVVIDKDVAAWLIKARVSRKIRA